MPLPTRGGANRRRYKRFQVDVPGTVLVDGKIHPVMISDLSSGGALVYLRTPVANLVSTSVLLYIENFGSIPAKIVRTGDKFWGVAFVNPHQYRFRLLGWLNQEVKGPE